MGSVDLNAINQEAEQLQRRLGALQATLKERERQHQELEEHLRAAGYPVDSGPEAVAAECARREQQLEAAAQAAQEANRRAALLLDQAEGKVEIAV
jgi:predicted  nucleic acid-binding Zn-ribbon protein